MKEEIKNDIIMQIEMESYMKYNNTIATMNEHLGEMYGYNDVKDMEYHQLEFEKNLAYKYLKKEHQALLDIKEYIEEHFTHDYGQKRYFFEDYTVDDLYEIVTKAIGEDK